MYCNLFHTSLLRCSPLCRQLFLIMSNLQRIWVLVSLLVIFLSAVSEGALVKDGNRTAAAATICKTKTCIAAAKTIREAMDTSTDPCDDFYQYACGGYIATHAILDNETDAGTYRDVIKTAKYIRQDVVASKNDPQFISEGKVKTLYKQCADEEYIEKIRGRPLVDFLRTVAGGWPLLDADWNASTFDLFDVLVSVRSYLYQPFFTVMVDKNLWDPSINSLTFDQPTTTLSKDVLLGKDGKLVVESYAILIENVTSLLRRDAGTKEDAFSILETAEMINDIVELEKTIAMAKLTAVEARSVSRFKNMTLQDLQKSSLPRSAFGQQLLQFINDSFKYENLWETIDPSTIVTVSTIKYLPQLDNILVALESQGDLGKRRLSNYIGWRIALDGVQYLSKDYRDAKSEHVQRTRGAIVLPQTPTAERCTNQALSILPIAIGAMYVRDVVPPKLREKVEKMMMINET